MSWRTIVGATVLVVALSASVAAWTVRSDEGDTQDFALVRDGEALFLAKGCAGCHEGPAGTGVVDSGFPDLSDAAEWAGDRRPGMSAEEYIAESIRQPNAFRSPAFTPGGAGPATGMPTLTVSDEEIDALVDYLLHG